jgi:hypothetical protein
MVNYVRFCLDCIAFLAVTCELLRSDDINYVQWKRLTPMWDKPKSATSLENAVDKVAANSGASAKDCSVTQLLAELLTVLLELARSLAFAVTHA